MTQDDFMQEVQAVLIAAAHEELMPRFAEVSRKFKPDGSLVTAADTAMQRRMHTELTRRWSQYDFLGEETPEPEQQKILHKTDGAGMWCLDPLDGTSNFVHGIPFFTTSLALVVDGRPFSAWTYDPVRGECFSAQRGRGAWLNDIELPRTIETPMLPRCMAAVDLKRLGPKLGSSLGHRPPYSSQRSFGSSALEWCWLAASRIHVYLHGAQKLWDYAAGTLILSEAGGHARTLEGAEVFACDLKPRSVVAARDAALFQAWRAWIAANS